MIFGALPRDCERVLDVGCGEGMLAARLSPMVTHVTGIDCDATTIELARRDASAENVDYVVADFLTATLEPESFDAVVSITAIHHMDTERALERMRALVRPGGTIAIVGLARSQYPADLAFDAAGAIATRVHKLRKHYQYWETAAPKIDPVQTYGETRRVIERVLPGVHYRRRVLWRYSAVWTKPAVRPVRDRHPRR